MKKIFIVLALLSMLVVGCTSKKPDIRFKAIYFDMDGTLLGSDEMIRPETIAAIEQYHACGGKVGIVSGRTFNEVDHFISDLKPDLPLILFNGGVVFSPSGDRILHRWGFGDVDVVVSALSVSGHLGVTATIVQYEDKTIVDHDTPEAREIIDMGMEICDEIDKCVTRMADGGKLPVKMIFVAREESLELIADEVTKAVGEGGRVVISSPMTVEVLPKGVDKAIALKKVLSDYGLSRDDVVVFGDSGNDTNMVSEMPVSIAMGNCRQTTCDAALFKIGSNDTDAIARTIRRLVLLDTCQR